MHAYNIYLYDTFGKNNVIWLFMIQIHVHPLPGVWRFTKDDGSYAPILIRLAWHSSGAFNGAVLVGLAVKLCTLW